MDPAGQVAQLDERLLGLPMGVLDQALGAGRVRVPLLPGPAQIHRQRHQPLLGAVVEVTFYALALDLHRVDHAGTAVGERGDLLVQLLRPARTEQQGGQLSVQHGHQADGEGHEWHHHEAEDERRHRDCPSPQGDVRPHVDLVAR